MKILAFLFSLALLVAGAPPAQAQQKDTGTHTPVHNSVAEEMEEEEEDESLEVEEKHRRSVWYLAMQKKNPDYFEVRRLFDAYFRKNRNEKSKPKQICADWLKTQIFYLDRKGRVMAPPKINYNSLKSFGPSNWATVTDTMAGDWRMLGPRNMYETGYSGKGNKGGYASLVRIDPTNSSKLFVSFITGGLWVSSDGGKVWQLTDKNMPDGEYIDIDVCRANNLVVYALNKSGAVIKSTDGGLTWSATAMNATNYPNATRYDIAVSPSNPDVVLARWGTNLYRSVDGGNSWSVVLNGLKNYSVWGGTGISSEMLDFHAADGGVVYLVDRNDNQNFVTLYRSADGGASFTSLGNINIPAGATGTVVGWAKILSATNNPGVVYLAMGTGSNAYGHNPIQLFKLNATTGAVLQTRVNMTGENGVHHGDIAMDFNNDNNIVYGTYGETRAHFSTNNGASFQTSATTVHADLRTLSILDGKVLLGNDGEATISTDGGNTFTNLTAAVSNHELWGFGAAFKSDVLGAGLNHGPLMIREHEGPLGWYNAMGADQGNSDVNPLDDRYLYSQGYSSYHVVRTGQYTMNANTPQQIDPGGIYAYFNSMEFHPNLYYTLITHHAGGFPSGHPNLALWKRSLIRSDDNGISVRVIKTFDNAVFREKISMRNPNHIYVVEGMSNNRLWKTTDGGNTWSEITPGTGVTGTGIRNISDIAVSDVNPNEIWITYSGVQNTCQVLHSTDAGATYSNLTTPVLTSFPLTKIIFQRGTNGGVYVGNKSGVFYRNNTMSDWQPIGSGLPMLDVRFMFINYFKGKLQIGTSRGAWDHDLYEQSNMMAQIAADRDTIRCTIKNVQFRDYSVVKKGATVSYAWSFPGGTPATSTEENPLVSYASAAPGRYNVSLTITDGQGSSTQTLTNFIVVAPGSECEIDSVAGGAGNLTGSLYTLPAHNLNTNKLTITAWIKPSGKQADYSGIVFENGSTKSGFNFTSNNQLGYHWNGQHWGWGSGLLVPQNEWSHVAMVVTPDSVTLYLNGVAKSNVAAHTPALLNADWNIGRYYDWTLRSFIGNIDEVTLWNRSLSAQEIRELLHQTRTVSDSGLISYVQFNESTSISVIDKMRRLPVSGPARVASTAPVGRGGMVTKNVPNGNYEGTGAAIVYGAASTAGSAITANRIWGKPAGAGGLGAAILLDGQYWSIDRFDTGSYSGALSLMVKDSLERFPQYTDASKYKLFTRPLYSDGAWQIAATATSINTNTKTITFNPVTQNGQFAIGYVRPPLADSVAGNMVVFDGAGTSKGTVPPSDWGTTNTLTIMGWFKPSGVQKSFAGLVTSAHGGAVSLNLRDNNEIGYHWAGNQWAWSSSTTLSANQWSHVALVVTPAAATIYVNGEPIANNTAHPGVTINGAWYIASDRTRTDRNFNGNMDEVSIWTRALSATEVREAMHQPLTGYEENLKVYLQFNEAQASLVKNIVDGTGVAFTNTTITGSTIPLGAGGVASVVERAGTVNFGDAQVSVSYAEQLGKPVTVSRINGAPNTLAGLASGDTLLAGQYWSIDRFLGGTTSVIQNISFRTGEQLAPQDAVRPGRYKLYHRALYSDGPWAFISGAGKVDHSSGIIHFPGITANGQFALAKGSVAPPDSVRGKALAILPGANTYVSVPAGITTNTISFTAWIKPEAVQSWKGLVFHNGNSTSGLNFSTNNQLGYHWNDNHWDWASGLIAAPNEWAHVAMVVTPDSVTLYLNGTGSIHKASIGVADLNKSFLIGSDRAYADRNFKGQIEEVTVWERALTEQEIRELMHQTLKGDEPGLSRYVQFNNATGNIMQESASGIATRLVGGTAANWVESTVAIGNGGVISSTEKNGAQDWRSKVGVLLNYPKHAGKPLTISRIAHQPYGVTADWGIAPGEQVLGKQYWVTHRFADSLATAFRANYRFKVGEPFNSLGSAVGAANFKLYWRPFNSDSAWTFVKQGDEVDPTVNSITFSQIAQKGQFVITYVHDSGPVTANMAAADAALVVMPEGATGSYRVNIAEVLRTFHKNNKNLPVLVRMFDMSGTEVLPAKRFASEENIRVNLAHLPAGVYLMKVQVEQKEYTRKLVR